MFKSRKNEKKATIFAEQFEIEKICIHFLKIRSTLLSLPGEAEIFISLSESLQDVINENPRLGSLSRVRNICPFTGRTRGFYTFAKFSRREFKYLAACGRIPGRRKAS